MFMIDSTTEVQTKRPKNNLRWEHRELLSVISDPATKRVMERDGLYGVVRRAKDGTPSVLFRWRFRFNKTLADFTAGSFPKDTLKEIRDAHKAAVELHDAGKNPNTELKLQKLNAASAQVEQVRVHNEETVKVLALKWQKLELTKRGKKGRKDDGAEVIRSFEADIFPRFGDSPLASVPRNAWAAVFDEVKSRAPRMAARLFADTQQFLDWCERREFIDISPVHKIRKSDIAAPYEERQRFLYNPNSSQPEAELLELQEKLPGAHLKKETELALWLMLGTGCRVGEVSMAAWSHISFEKREWVFPAPNTKTKKEHRVYLSDFALTHLKALHQLTGHKPWCFPAKHEGKEHIDDKTISKQVGDRQKSEPMKNRSKSVATLILSGGEWTPHDLRRTAAIIMGSVGTDPLTIEGCINHVMPKLTRTYQKEVAWERKREAWDKLGQRLAMILSISASPALLPNAD